MKQYVSELMDQRLNRLGAGDIGAYSNDFLEEVAVAALTWRCQPGLARTQRPVQANRR